ncbi:MAG: hypothetical protein AAB699_01905 [Patescibacteria group bacterium]
MAEQFPKPESEEERGGLHRLLTYENPNLSRYQLLIEREFGEKRHQYGQEFAHQWCPVFHNRYGKGEAEFEPEDYKKVLPYLKLRLQGQLLIDLGGNLSKQGVMVQLAKKCGATSYINVDTEYVPKGTLPFGDNYDPYRGMKRDDTYPLLSEAERKREMLALNVQADMLNFTARLPHNSANFVMNGIDFDIVEKPEYWNALEEEITRATRVGGVLFGYGSEMMHFHFDPHWRSVGEELEFDDGSTYIQQKIFERVA